MFAVVATDQHQAMAGVDGEAFDHRQPPAAHRPDHRPEAESAQGPGAEGDQAEDKDEGEGELEGSDSGHGLCF